MKKVVCNLFIPLFTVIFILTGCDMSSPGGDSAEAVTFTVPIEVTMFYEDATLQVRLWNAEQLEIMEETANCTISYNSQTQTEEVHCPQGIDYKEVTPEEFAFPVQEISASIEVRSDIIRLGEKYRILISGLNNDNCNTTSAEVVDIAGSANVVLEDLVWRTTAMACP